MKQPITPRLSAGGPTGYCDACNQKIPVSLLTPIGEGALRACPKCLAEARTLVKADPRKGLRLVRSA